MKKKVIFTVLLVLSLNSSAQYWYNKYYDKSLSELNYEELSFLKEKSNQTSFAGGVLTVAGAGLILGATIVGVEKAVGDLLSWEFSGNYGGIIIAYTIGIVATAVGVPTLIIGSANNRTIRKAINNLQENAMLQIIPSVRYNYTVHGYYPGLTLSISF